jgi:hypothetical protein
MADLMAPAVAGTYALNQLRTFCTSWEKGALTIIISMGIGYDIGSELAEYRGGNDTLRMLRDHYARIHATIANKATDVHDPGASGAAIGGLSAILSSIFEGYKR